jgi:hypothetical protein
MGGSTEDPRTAAEKVPSVTDSFTNAAPGIWDGAKHLGSQFSKLMDENPNATKWISFGVALLAGVAWGGSLVHGILANIAPKLADNGLISGLVTCLVWVGAFIGASKLSDYLANKGAGVRADERQAAGEQQRQRMAAFNTTAGTNPGGRPFSADTSTDPNLLAQNGGRVNPADRYQAAFANAGRYPQGGAPRPQGRQQVFVEDGRDFVHYPLQPY